MAALAKILELLSENPSRTISEIAALVGVTRQRVSQICAANGIKAKDGRRGAKPRKAPIPGGWKNHFGGPHALSSHFIGGASELCACADLLRKGVPVYRAVTFVSSADLIIDCRGRLMRVEVRSAKRNSSGSLRYPVPSDKTRYDVLALVEGTGAVTYKPDIFSESAEGGIEGS